jgi:hypothetical protein
MLWVDQNKDYQINGVSHTAAFALRIGESNGDIWACSNGHVLHEQILPYRCTYLILRPSDQRIVLTKSNTWPAVVRKNLYSL